MSMKVAVVGTINYDTVVSEDGDRFESFGGILYNIVALAQLEPGIEIYPITWIGQDRKDQLQELLDKYPQVKTEEIKVSPSGTNANLLVYRSAERRDETLDPRVPPIALEQIEPFLDCDLLLINFISGFDLSLETLTRLRRSFQGTIFMDIHSLILGLDEKGRRFLRRLEEWESWVRCGDIIQANRIEAELLTGLELKAEKDYQEAGSAILDSGPSTVLFTLGEEGCLVAYRKGHEKFFSLIPAGRVKVKDPTGAGDVFSATFIINYMKTKDPLRSAQIATSTASNSCQHMGLTNFKSLGVAGT